MTFEQTKEQFLLAYNSNAYLNMCESDDMHNVISALEKQIPKKPINRKGTTYFHCPVCDGNMLNNYCADCGQAILWESE